jgi:hypothetical protein
MGMDEETDGNDATDGLRWIPEVWLYRPQFHLWPPQRHRAVLWLLAKLVEFRAQRCKLLTTHDYYDFLRRSKWKLYQQHNRLLRVRNYLGVLDTLDFTCETGQKTNLPILLHNIENSTV